MKKEKVIWMMFAFCILITSCTGMDEYLNIVGRDEIIYPGKIDSVKVFSGHDRLVIEGLCKSDSKVIECEIKWNQGRDSLIVPVDMTNGEFKLIAEILLTEGVYNFDLRTRDAFRNYSIPVNITGVVYGEGYLLQIRNRLVNRTAMSGTSAIVTWYPLDTTLGPLYSELTYTTTDGEEKIVRSEVTDQQVELENIDRSKPVSLVTVFKPEETCLDVFSSQPYEFYINEGN